MEREFKIGEIFRTGGRSFICIESGDGTSCYDCALLGTQKCDIALCMARYRSDGNNVHFEKA